MDKTLLALFYSFFIFSYRMSFLKRSTNGRGKWNVLSERIEYIKVNKTVLFDIIKICYLLRSETFSWLLILAFEWKYHVWDKFLNILKTLALYSLIRFSLCYIAIHHPMKKIEYSGVHDARNAFEMIRIAIYY